MDKQVHSNSNPAGLKNKGGCETIRETLKQEIITLTDRQAEYVLRRLKCLLREKS